MSLEYKPIAMATRNSIERTGTRWNPVVLRLALGIVFVVSGLGKVLGIGPKASGIAGFAETLAGLGLPLPTLFAWAVGLVELVGGGLLIVGLFTRYAAGLLAVIMAVATVLVHLPYGFVAGDGGIEYTLVLTLVSLALVLSGPGACSLERYLFDEELFVPADSNRGHQTG